MDDETNVNITDSRIPYLRLLNSLANDLDYMLNDLYTTPPSRLHMSGDAFLEPYMEGLSNDDELLDDNCNGLKKELQENYSVNEDRTSSVSSPVNSADTPLDEKIDSHFRLIEVHAGSHGSLNQLISDDECSETASENSSLIGEEETPCDITLVERLIRSHPIWFLPGIQRAGAFHLLQGKEDGNFIVRQSSQNSTMAISVRLPSGKGPYIEHYLIQVSEDEQIGLESSDNKFTNIPLLIAHYCQCCDELPVQLMLPRTIREAKNRQQLTSLALLGQEFWRYPMANSRQAIKLENDSSNSLPSVSVQGNNVPIPTASFVNSSGSNSPASSLSSFDSSNNINSSTCIAFDQLNSVFDTDSSILQEESSTPSNNVMTTFKGSPVFSSIPYNQIGIPVAAESPSSLPMQTSHSQMISIRRTRPTPPSTLNLVSNASCGITKTSDNHSETGSTCFNLLTSPTSKTPPPPPPRWTKPFTNNNNNSNNIQNFIITSSSPCIVNKETPPSDTNTSSFQTFSSMEKHLINTKVVQSTTLTISLPTIVPTPLPRSHVPQTTTLVSSSPTSQILSPVSEGNTRPFHRRIRRHKESYHYRESDIIESYHRSTVADKVSDYEDIWGPDSLSTFKPQPPPRSLQLSSLDNSSLKKKTNITSLTPDVSEKSLILSPVTSEANKNRFGLIFGISEGESSSVAISSSVTAKTCVISSIADTSTQNISIKVEPTINNSFYAEPADAINAVALKRRTKSSVPSAYQRHSDPTSLHQWPTSISDGSVLERIDSKEELIVNGCLSSSVDNLVVLRNSKRIKNITQTLKNVKPVEVPKLNLSKSKSNGETWTIDPNWEFISKEGSEEDDFKFDEYKNTEEELGLLNEQLCKTNTEFSDDRTLTVQDMIFQRLPELRLSPICNKMRKWIKCERRVSDQLVPDDCIFVNNYNKNVVNDSNNNSNNFEKIYHNGMSMLSQISDTSDDTQTEFSDPWDSSQWEHLLNKSNIDPIVDDNTMHINRCKSFKEKLDPLLSPPRLKALAQTRGMNSTPGATVRAYAFKLAAEKETVFAKAIDNFIACTIESRETKPQVVMRNIRQFMSGMKNYLVTHGEGEFIKEVESERSKLKSTEFLNLDAILEGVMHKLVISPLKFHLCQLFVKEYEENGALQTLVDNIRYARRKSPNDLGIKEKLVLPTADALEKISDLFNKLQKADSPLEKLEFLLSAIAKIFHSIKEKNSGTEAIFLGADDFLPIFVWVLVQTGMIAAEVEAEYMWGLLHPSLLSGEGGYYLTTLSSAVNVLKNFRQCTKNDDVITTIPWSFDPLAEFKCIFKVVVPNELNGSLLTKTLPVRPNMSTKDICKIIALKLRITNPQDFSLYKLVDGEETLLNDFDCPQDIKCELAKAGKHCLFAYKRMDAKIAWPRSSTLVK